MAPEINLGLYLTLTLACFYSYTLTVPVASVRCGNLSQSQSVKTSHLTESDLLELKQAFEQSANAVIRCSCS